MRLWTTFKWLTEGTSELERHPQYSHDLPAKINSRALKISFIK